MSKGLEEELVKIILILLLLSSQAFAAADHKCQAKPSYACETRTSACVWKYLTFKDAPAVGTTKAKWSWVDYTAWKNLNQLKAVDIIYTSPTSITISYADTCTTKTICHDNLGECTP